MTVPSTTHSTIAQVSPTETITYRMPNEVYEAVARILDTWRYVYGRRPHPTVERALSVLERAIPNVRQHVETTREKSAPTVRGHKATVVFKDDWVYRQWMRQADSQDPRDTGEWMSVEQIKAVEPRIGPQ